MSRLINFGTGEVCDRLTILALKILHAERTGHEGKHFRDEQTALVARLTARKGSIQSEAWRGLFGLAAINGRLWEAEDEMRRLRDASTAHVGNASDAFTASVQTQAVVSAAFAIQDLNDRRAQAVEAINRVTGEHLGAEKTP